MAATWPPTLEGLKADSKAPNGRDDVFLQIDLDAAIAYVMRVRQDLNYTADAFDTRPVPTADFILGVYRLAGRWNARRRSQDGVIMAGDQGTSRIPSYDADIERMLGIGRFKKLGFA